MIEALLEHEHGLGLFFRTQTSNLLDSKRKASYPSSMIKSSIFNVYNISNGPALIINGFADSHAAQISTSGMLSTTGQP